MGWRLLRRRRGGGAAYTPKTDRWEQLPARRCPVARRPSAPGPVPSWSSSAGTTPTGRSMPTPPPTTRRPTPGGACRPWGPGACGTRRSGPVGTCWSGGGRTFHAGAWTAPAHGLAYDPAANRWSPLPQVAAARPIRPCGGVDQDQDAHLGWPSGQADRPGAALHRRGRLHALSAVGRPARPAGRPRSTCRPAPPARTGRPTTTGMAAPLAAALEDHEGLAAQVTCPCDGLGAASPTASSSPHRRAAPRAPPPTRGPSGFPSTKKLWERAGTRKPTPAAAASRRRPRPSRAVAASC